MSSTDLDAAPTPLTAVGGGRPRPWSRVAEQLSFRRISAIYLLIALVVLFAIWVPDTFLQSSTLTGILADQAVTALIAVGITLPLAAGAFDISIGLALGAANVNVAYLIVHQHWSPALAVLAAIAFALAVGAISGFLVVGAGLTSIIATLGVSSVLTAYVVWVSSNQQIVLDPTSPFTEFTSRELLGVATPFWVMLVVAFVVWYVLTQRPVGRQLYATGGGREAARLSGVRVRTIVFASLVLSSAIAGLAGILLASRIGVGSPTAGPPYMIPAFAAAFLGATQFGSGRFNVWGTVLAVYVLAVGVKGLQLVGAPHFVSDLFNGVALIFAVWLSRLQRARRDSEASKDARPSGGVQVEQHHLD